MFYYHNSQTRSLYIHWPFCPYRCSFCPFVALAGQDHHMVRYHEALKKEIIRFAQNCDQRLQLETIYFGGGTPSTYPNELLLDMSDTLRKMFDISSTTEITLEVNPGTVTDDQIPAWQEVGINRISIGVQSLKDPVLKRLNRHQSLADVQGLLARVDGKFEHISVDMILGLPGVSDTEWKEMIGTVVTWPINHMSVYFLTIHEGTGLYYEVKQKKIELPCDDGVVDLYHWTREFLKLHGLEQYEVSSFSRSGHQSRHNKAYWQRKPFKGFGIGAFSFDGAARYQNEKNIMRYMENINQSNEVTIFSEKLSAAQVHVEKIMLGIRQMTGISIQDIYEGLNEQDQGRLSEQIVILKQAGYIAQREERLVITPIGLSIEHTIAQKLSFS